MHDRGEMIRITYAGGRGKLFFKKAPPEHIEAMSLQKDRYIEYKRAGGKEGKGKCSRELSVCSLHCHFVCFVHFYAMKVFVHKNARHGEGQRPNASRDGDRSRERVGVERQSIGRQRLEREREREEGGDRGMRSQALGGDRRLAIFFDRERERGLPSPMNQPDHK